MADPRDRAAILDQPTTIVPAAHLARLRGESVGSEPTVVRGVGPSSRGRFPPSGVQPSSAACDRDVDVVLAAMRELYVRGDTSAALALADRIAPAAESDDVDPFED